MAQPNPVRERPEAIEPQAAVFGQHENLIGIYQPAEVRPIWNEFAAVMVTPGMLHSAGPFRLHSDLAQQLSRVGIPSLRFDLSGIGESLAVGRQGTSLERAAAEIGEALDWIQAEYGHRKLALFGLCSGADDAVFAALTEQRIAGLFLMDGCGYRTPGYFPQRFQQHYLPKLMSPNKWLNLLGTTLGLSSSEPETLQMGFDIREFPSRSAAEQQICELAARDVFLHFHYTGGADDYYNYAGQFDEMFPQVRFPNVTHSFSPQCDHVAFLREDRRAVVQQVTQYFTSIANSLTPQAPAIPAAILNAPTVDMASFTVDVSSMGAG